MTAIKLLEAWNQFDEPTFTAAVQDSQQVDKMVSVGLALRSTLTITPCDQSETNKTINSVTDSTVHAARLQLSCV